MSAPSESPDLDAVFDGMRTEGPFDAELWRRLAGGPVRPGGGHRGALPELARVLVEAGARAARVPLVESELLAAWLADAAGVAAGDGPLTATVADELTVRPTDGGVRVDGVLPGVPWAGCAARLVVLSGPHVVALDPAELRIESGANLAGEPRDTVVVADLVLPHSAVGPAPVGAAEEFRLRAAVGRTQLMAGAAREVLAQSVAYAREREQFGRPIARFQAVTQQLAIAAAEVAAALTAAAACVRTVERDGWGAGSTVLAVAAAKVRAGVAAGIVARTAHQVHGAVGFTTEVPLGRLTARLWAWRDEDGTESWWSEALGALALAGGADGLWGLVSESP